MWIGTFHAIGARMLRATARARRVARPRSRSTTRTTRSPSSSASWSGIRISPKQFTPQAICERRSPTRRTRSCCAARVRAARDGPVLAARPRRSTASSRRRCAKRTPSTSTTCWCCRCACCARTPTALASYRERFQFILVDEYQDTNRAQYQFVKLLGRRARQRVRRRRRRSVDLRLARRRHPQHPRLREGFPERARRAARGELSLAPADPRRRERRHQREHVAPTGKTLRPTRPGGERVTVVGALDERDEADWVVEEIAARLHGRARRSRCATSRSCTAPTRRAARSRRRCAGAPSRTASSGRCASTTGARSAT